MSAAVFLFVWRSFSEIELAETNQVDPEFSTFGVAIVEYSRIKSWFESDRGSVCWMAHGPCMCHSI